jgi:hypothetical protein
VADYDLELSKYNTALDAWQKAEAAKKRKASLQLAASPPNPSGAASESGAAGAAALVAMAGSTDPPAR